MPDRFFESVIAKEFGVTAALIYNRIKWSVEMHRKNKQIEYFEHDEWWMYDTLGALAEYAFCNEKTVRRSLKKLLDSGRIKIKKLKKHTGDLTNFYSIETPSGQNVHMPPSGQNVQTLPDKMSRSSSTENPPRVLSYMADVKNTAEKKEQSMKKDGRNFLWSSKDPMAKIFENLNRLEVCKNKFDTEEYRQYLTGLAELLDLSIEELEESTFEWQEYHNDRTEQPKSPKSSFRTWIKNYTERRNRNAWRSKNKPEQSSTKEDNEKWAFLDRAPGESA